MQKPLRPCKHASCITLTSDSYCDIHKDKNKEKKRKSAAGRGYGHKWRKVSKQYLLRHPFCVECRKQGMYEAATEVDHIVPHKGNMNLFWDKTNWQGLCKSCHARKTACEDGGFGREMAPR